MKNRMFGLRRPTDDETAIVGEYMRLYFRPLFRTYLIACTLCAILGGVFVLGSFQDYQDGTSVFPELVIGLCLVAGIPFFVKERNDDHAMLDMFLQGDFNVLDGKVSRIIRIERTAWNGIEFVSDYGEVFPIKPLAVRLEGLKTGIPILLVVMENGKKDFIKAFTPFMLSHEGIRYQ